MSAQRWMSIQEFSNELGVSDSYIYRLIRKGIIVAEVINKIKMVDYNRNIQQYFAATNFKYSGKEERKGLKSIQSSNQPPKKSRGPIVRESVPTSFDNEIPNRINQEKAYTNFKTTSRQRNETFEFDYNLDEIDSFPLPVKLKVEKELRSAELLRMEVQEKRGELLPKQEVLDFIFTSFRAQRNNALALQGEIKSVLANNVDQDKLNAMTNEIDASIRNFCNTFSDEIGRLLEKKKP